MWVCSKCFVNAYADNCPLCGLTESEANPLPTDDADEPVTCPLCGAAAEQGCVYGSDRGWRLRWYAGPARFWANLVTGFGGGEQVGGWNFASGPYVGGVRCDRCKRIILKY
jgi:hypothetical protein